MVKKGDTKKSKTVKETQKHSAKSDLVGQNTASTSTSRTKSGSTLKNGTKESKAATANKTSTPVETNDDDELSSSPESGDDIVQDFFDNDSKVEKIESHMEYAAGSTGVISSTLQDILAAIIAKKALHQNSNATFEAILGVMKQRASIAEKNGTAPGY